VEKNINIARNLPVHALFSHLLLLYAFIICTTSYIKKYKKTVVTVRSPQSTGHSPQSTVHCPQSTVHSLESATHSPSPPQSTVPSPQSTVSLHIIASSPYRA
jgi:hypothetical protein